MRQGHSIVQCSEDACHQNNRHQQCYTCQPGILPCNPLRSSTVLHVFHRHRFAVLCLLSPVISWQCILLHSDSQYPQHHTAYRQKDTFHCLSPQQIVVQKLKKQPQRICHTHGLRRILASPKQLCRQVMCPAAQISQYQEQKTPAAQ